MWASEIFGLTSSHPAGKDESGNPKRNLWRPPEGTAAPPPEENNPLFKLLMDISSSQESLLEDHLLLTNRFNLHRCSDYCLKSSKSNASQKFCRMEFPKELRSFSGYERRSSRPVLFQHSKFHTQGWRANRDISSILSKSDPSNPSVDDILATEKYIIGYACKGNEPTSSFLSFL